MGNIEAHDFAPVRPDERKELNLSRKPTYKQFLKHLNGEAHEACLTEIPYSLRDSICLYEIMKAAFNAITELPPELPLRLPHLRYLDLSHNRLESLPCSFGLFFHLDTLLMPHNRLTSLPSTFTRLINLQKVDLSNNLLRELPEDLGEMEKLQRLSLAHNKLRNLPISLGNAAKLSLILAEGNRLDSPPQSVCDEGSASTLQYLQKQYKAHRDQSPPRPRTPLNEFPRHRNNQLHSPAVTNPHSAHVQYIQEQTDTTNTPRRFRTPLRPPLGSSSYDALDLRDKILGLIYGAALGDVAGLSTRWMSPDQCQFYYGSSDHLLDFSNVPQDRHRVPWRQGDWTSNFDNFMLVLDSLINWAGVVDELDFAKRLAAWSQHGFPELGDSAGIHISSTISQVVADKRFTSSPHSAATAVLQHNTAPAHNGGPVASPGHSPGHSTGHSPGHSTDYSNSPATTGASGDATTDYTSTSSKTSPPHSPTDGPPASAASLEMSCRTIGPLRVEEASSCSQFGSDNGAVIRSAALGIPSFHDLQEVKENSVRICQATHADPQCVASCVFISLLVATLLQGSSPDEEKPNWDRVIDPAKQRALSFLSDPIHREQFISHLDVTTFEQLDARQTGEMSHTFKPVAAAVLALRWSGSFLDFVQGLAMEGGDSNSNCCVGGAVLGLLKGYKHLPPTWLQALRGKQLTWLNLRLNMLLDMMALP